MKYTKHLLIGAALVAVVGFNVPAHADMEKANNDYNPQVYKTTRITTTTQTTPVSADVEGGTASELESAVIYSTTADGEDAVDPTFAAFDLNRDGRITSIEYKKTIPATSPTQFTDVDRDGNGLLNESEFNNVILDQLVVSETVITQE